MREGTKCGVIDGRVASPRTLTFFSAEAALGHANDVGKPRDQDDPGYRLNATGSRTFGSEQQYGLTVSVNYQTLSSYTETHMTTDTTGKLSELTLADLQKLRLRSDEGGARVPLTDQRVVALDQMPAASKCRILLNLDVKDAIYVQVIDAVARLGMQHQVIVKAEAGIATPLLAGMVPFNTVYFFPT